MGDKRVVMTLLGGVLALFLALGYSGVWGGLAASAGDPEGSKDTHAQRERSSPQEALSIDAAMYASEVGVSQEEAERRLALQASGALSDTIVQLSEASPEMFAGAWIEHTPDLHIVVRYVAGSAGQDTIDQAVALAPVPIEVRADAAHSLDALREQASSMRQRVLETFPGSGMGTDVRTGTVRFYLLAGEHDISRIDAVADALESRFEAPFQFEFESRGFRNAMMYGGHRLTGGDDPCTTSFVVVDPSWKPGILTAGHCASNLTYHLEPPEWPSSQWPLVLEQSLFTNSHDLQWHSHSSATFHPEFFTGSSTGGYRELTQSAGVSSHHQDVGSYVCNFGVEGGYGCGWIISNKYGPPTQIIDPLCPTVCDDVYVLVEGPELTCISGDSGGPVFISSTGLGVLKAEGADACIYQPINAITALGVYTVPYAFGPLP